MIMIKDYRVVSSCRICGSSRLYKFLDLGHQPIPNGFIKPTRSVKRENKYPLNVLYCQDCGLVQLGIVVNPGIMFSDYPYLTSQARVMLNNFSNLAHEAYKLKSLNEKSLVVDIGSNDGSLLKFFKGYDAQVVGIDPARNIAEVAELSGIPTVVDFFRARSAKKVVKKYGRADVVCATNVIAHTDNLPEIFDSLDILLKKDGVFITEFPYLMDLVDKLEFDTIYHEHLSYFSLKPWKMLVERKGYRIVDVKRLPIHGGSIRITHQRAGRGANNIKTIPKALDFLIKLEQDKGLNDKDSFKIFADRVGDLKTDLLGLLIKLKSKGKRIVGYGAAAKGNVLTNYFGIGTQYLDFIVDSTPYKQGLITPGMHIPIYAENRLLQQMPDYAIILAWNFADEIVAKQKKYRQLGGKFIIPIPAVRII